METVKETKIDIKKTRFAEVEKYLAIYKPDILDKSAIYQGAYHRGKLVGVVSFIDHPSHIYLGHAFVLPEWRGIGIYKLLWEYRNSIISQIDKPLISHCNLDNLEYFIEEGFKIEKALFKVVKE